MSQWTNNRPVCPNELYHYGVMGIGVATGRPVLGGLIGASAMNSMNPDIYRSSREYSQRYDPNSAKTFYKNTIATDKALAKIERQEMARKNYLRTNSKGARHSQKTHLKGEKSKWKV